VTNHHEQERVILNASANVGFCRSFEQLLKSAPDGDYWAFCDQDDYWYPDKIAHAVEWMQRQQAPDIPLLYHSRFEIGNADLTEKIPYTPSQFEYQFSNAFTSNIFFGFGIVINRGLYERLVQADFGYIMYHDWFAAIITAAFGKYHMSQEIEAVHRQHAHNASPLYFFKKFPDGVRLLRGDNFYTRNAREFRRLFGDELNAEQKEIVNLFVNEKYHLRTALRKTFWKRRWNPQWKVEVVLRGLMLLGKV
jgi:glycosyltransferase involved in cell wall biosynthesis